MKVYDYFEQLPSLSFISASPRRGFDPQLRHGRVLSFVALALLGGTVFVKAPTVLR